MAVAEAPGLAPRRMALEMLGAVLDRGRMLEEAPGGTGAERAQALGLARTVLRHLGEIDAALKPLVARPPKGPGRQLLRLMTGEIRHAGTPPHAAVDSAVRLARASKGTARLAGLVNAVGRRLGEAVPEPAPDAARLNTPGWFWTALTREWGRETARRIAEAHLAGAPHDLTPRGETGIEGAARLPTGSLRLEGRAQLSELPGFAEGLWWAQDAAAALPARLIPAPAGRRVLDLCAAPGGKTLQLAAAGAEVTALDLSERRLERLRENLTRTGLAADIVAADALDWSPEAPFDAILLDAPCTATGTVRRHPDLPWRKGAADAAPLIALQRRLMERAWGWLRPGGTLVFCTCSLLKAEGEAQAEAFLAATPDAARLPVRAEEVGGAAELIDQSGDLRTRPDHWAGLGGMDGFFAARFARAA